MPLPGQAPTSTTGYDESGRRLDAWTDPNTGRRMTWQQQHGATLGGPARNIGTGGAVKSTAEFLQGMPGGSSQYNLTADEAKRLATLSPAVAAAWWQQRAAEGRATPQAYQPGGQFAALPSDTATTRTSKSTTSGGGGGLPTDIPEYSDADLRQHMTNIDYQYDQMLSAELDAMEDAGVLHGGARHSAVAALERQRSSAKNQAQADWTRAKQDWLARMMALASERERWQAGLRSEEARATWGGLEAAAGRLAAQRGDGGGGPTAGQQEIFGVQAFGDYPGIAGGRIGGGQQQGQPIPRLEDMSQAELIKLRDNPWGHMAGSSPRFGYSYSQVAREIANRSGSDSLDRARAVFR